jgi:hypothetical protein
MGIAVSFTVTGLPEVKARFLKARRVKKRVEAVNNAFTPILLQTLVRHASGRPGPQIQTGAFVSAFEVVAQGDTIVGYNPSPQTARLEFGFVGADSAGRHYAQPPYPVFAPAFAEVGPVYAEVMKREMLAALQ